MDERRDQLPRIQIILRSTRYLKNFFQRDPPRSTLPERPRIPMSESKAPRRSTATVHAVVFPRGGMKRRMKKPTGTPYPYPKARIRIFRSKEISKVKSRHLFLSYVGLLCSEVSLSLSPPLPLSLSLSCLLLSTLPLALPGRIARPVLFPPLLAPAPILASSRHLLLRYRPRSRSLLH
jgi:hypothetical protein